VEVEMAAADVAMVREGGKTKNDGSGLWYQVELNE
jgi:hypothetical protein